DKLNRRRWCAVELDHDPDERVSQLPGRPGSTLHSGRDEYHASLRKQRPKPSSMEAGVEYQSSIPMSWDYEGSSSLLTQWRADSEAERRSATCWWRLQTLYPLRLHHEL